MSEQKKPVIRKENFDFKYTFSAEELQQKSTQLAKACEDRNNLEDEKKSMTSGFKAKIDSKSAEINILSGHINAGYEHVTKTCTVQYDFDKGVKTYAHGDKIVGTVKMVAADYQLNAELPA